MMRSSSGKFHTQEAIVVRGLHTILVNRPRQLDVHSKFAVTHLKLMEGRFGIESWWPGAAHHQVAFVQNDVELTLLHSGDLDQDDEVIVVLIHICGGTPRMRMAHDNKLISDQSGMYVASFGILVASATLRLL